MRPAGLAVAAALILSGCGGSGSGTGTTVAVGNSKNGTTVIVNGAPPTERVYRVPSGSMEPTYRVGTRVRVKLGAPVSVGSVAVFHPPEGALESRCGAPRHAMTQGCGQANAAEDASTKFIKRVVAGPGDSLYIKDGYVYRKAAGSTSYIKASEPYVRPCAAAVGIVCNLTTPVTVPAGQWYLLGDNRGESDDSRFWGPVPTAWIVGTVTGAE